MAQLTIEKHIDAPREVVFDTALDLQSAAENIRGIQKLEVLTDGPVGIGTRFRETRVMFKKEATEIMEIVVMERPSRYVLKAESHGSKYLTSYDLEEVDSGTRLTMNFSSEPQTIAAKVLGVVFSLMMGAMRKAVEKDLDDLKAAVEGGSS